VEPNVQPDAVPVRVTESESGRASSLVEQTAAAVDWTGQAVNTVDAVVVAVVEHASATGQLETATVGGQLSRSLNELTAALGQGVELLLRPVTDLARAIAVSLEQLIQAIIQLIRSLAAVQLSPMLTPLPTLPAVRQAPASLTQVASTRAAEARTESLTAPTQSGLLSETAAAPEAAPSMSLPANLAELLGTLADIPLALAHTLADSSGSTLPTSISSVGHSGSAAVLLSLLAALIAVAWRPMQRQSLAIPTGIALASPLPPG
jgi:hypothetical protein